ncbi:MAG: hypothetical protein JXR96_24685 [Deltaproteobacteria bacterium]|nr:hypothetical protein [Deltaproteobacteria bacterium]
MRANGFWIAFVVLAAACAPGCLVIDHEDPGCIGDCDPGIGDIAFYWNFELESGELTDSCTRADVARVDIEVFDSYGDSEFAVYDTPCEGQGAILTDFLAGRYHLELVAHCRNGIISHEGWYDLRVDLGENDYGTLTLDYLRSCY